MRMQLVCFLGAAVAAFSCGGNETPGGSSASGGSGTASGGGGALTGAGGNVKGGSAGQDASAGAGGAAGSGGVAGSTAGAGGSTAGTGGSTAGTGGVQDSGRDGDSCATNCAATGLVCCGSVCVNTRNDILNCGTCNHRCDGPAPFCNNGTCGVPPCAVDAAACQSSAGTCCASECCTAGKLCCAVSRGPVFTSCTDPVNGTCPAGCPLCVCASADTPIATPGGSRPIQSIVVGDLVYSVDHGELAIVPVAAVQKVEVDGHVVRRVELASGETIEISARHPTADGRTFADLRRGDFLDGVEIRDVTTVPYRFGFTYDILPTSDTGAYFAGDVLIGSTMVERSVPPANAEAPMSH